MPLFLSIITGSKLIYNDRHTSCAVQDCLDWGFKILWFVDPYGDLKKAHGGETVELLVNHIVQDIGRLWKRRRNDNKIPGVPAQGRELKEPNPWPVDLVDEIRRYLHGYIVIPPISRGLCFLFFTRRKFTPLHLTASNFGRFFTRITGTKRGDFNPSDQGVLVQNVATKTAEDGRWQRLEIILDVAIYRLQLFWKVHFAQQPTGLRG